MFRTTAGALMLTMFAAVAPAAAAGMGGAEPEPQAAAAVSSVATATMPALVSSSALTKLTSDVDWSLTPVQFGGPRRGAALPIMYVTLAGLNAYDAYSTTKGISRGATESNPLMSGAAGNPAMMWAVKAGVTVGTITMAERLWRKDKRVQAIALMIVSNGVMATVAARNASILHRQ
jgi:hypothetical protein